MSQGMKPCPNCGATDPEVSSGNYVECDRCGFGCDFDLWQKESKMRTNEILHRPVQDTCAIVVCCDVSGSMRGQKIVRLREELTRLWPEVKAKLICFGFTSRWVEGGPNNLPEPSGSTDMRGALELAGTVFPSEVIVISDGRPDDEQGTLDAAAMLPGVINVLFVGDDGDTHGAAFMRRLAAVGGGVMCHRDLAKNMSIGGELRSMLALPPPIAL